jgi:hypothetical protein
MSNANKQTTTLAQERLDVSIQLMSATARYIAGDSGLSDLYP